MLIDHVRQDATNVAPPPPAAVRDRVLVGTELRDGTERTVLSAASVGAYVDSRRWDRLGLSHELLVQAQAEVLDEASLGFLRSRYGDSPSTSGWPGELTYRFETAGLQIMLAGSDQCDWWIASADADQLAEVIADLLPSSDLHASLWSDDGAAEALLDRIRRMH